MKISTFSTFKKIASAETIRGNTVFIFLLIILIQTSVCITLSCPKLQFLLLLLLLIKHNWAAGFEKYLRRNCIPFKMGFTQHYTKTQYLPSKILSFEEENNNKSPEMGLLSLSNLAICIEEA